MLQPQITVYTSSTCGVCQMMKYFLADMRIDYDEVHVGWNPVARAKLIARTGKLTVPQMKIGDKWISGFDPVQILQIVIKSEAIEVREDEDNG